MNTLYKGKHRKMFSLKVDKQRLTITVYRTDKTIVTTIDRDGNVETAVEPII